MNVHIFASLLIVLAVGFMTSAREFGKCNMQPDDTELTFVQIIDSGHVLGKVDIDFHYPPEGHEAFSVINCVKIKALSAKGTAKITSGKPGDTRMSIKLTSPFGSGASFTIQMFGQPIDKQSRAFLMHQYVV